MGPEQRTSLARDVALVCLADAIVGVSFGATVVAGGLPAYVPVAMSLLVFAGGAQFAAAGVALSGGGPVAAVAAGALLNTRLLPYGFAVADITSQGRWSTRLLAAHLTTDESVAFTLPRTAPGDRRSAFWACGLPLFIAWNAATILGTVAGTLVRHTGAFGLDSTFPAVMLTLALPSLADGRTRAAAGAGAVTAVALTPVLPAGLPVLAALAGLACCWRRR